MKFPNLFSHLESIFLVNLVFEFWPESIFSNAILETLQNKRVKQKNSYYIFLSLCKLAYQTYKIERI